MRNSGANYLHDPVQAEPRRPRARRFATTPERHRRQRLPGRVRQLAQDQPSRSANIIFYARQRARPLVGDPRRGPPAAPSPTPSSSQRNTDYATAIKAVCAERAGRRSGQLRLLRLREPAGRARRRRHGNFLDFYLDQMKAADTTAGKRLVDVLDLHWYPEATGGGIGITGADTTRRGRRPPAMQAPRSLWDPTYIETSWITDPASTTTAPINLIPRMQDAHRRALPRHRPRPSPSGTTAAAATSAAAIAAADVLGIFGREGVELASMWELNGDETYTYAALPGLPQLRRRRRHLRRPSRINGDLERHRRRHGLRQHLRRPTRTRW